MTAESRPIDSLRPYPSQLYDGVNLNWLVLIAVGKLEEIGFDLSFENVVVAAFKLFPKKFSLLTYPEHPDAKRVHDGLWRCAYKNRQWLMGKTSQGFAFTQRGRQELELARNALQTDNPVAKKTFSQTRCFERLLAKLKRHRPTRST